jgi:hypothetical protein
MQQMEEKKQKQARGTLQEFSWHVKSNNIDQQGAEELKGGHRTQFKVGWATTRQSWTPGREVNSSGVRCIKWHSQYWWHYALSSWSWLKRPFNEFMEWTCPILRQSHEASLNSTATNSSSFQSKFWLQVSLFEEKRLIFEDSKTPNCKPGSVIRELNLLMRVKNCFKNCTRGQHSLKRQLGSY